jgi:hypothetical protein
LASGRALSSGATDWHHDRDRQLDPDRRKEALDLLGQIARRFDLAADRGIGAVNLNDAADRLGRLARSLGLTRQNFRRPFAIHHHNGGRGLFAQTKADVDRTFLGQSHHGLEFYDVFLAGHGATPGSFDRKPRPRFGFRQSR